MVKLSHAHTKYNSVYIWASWADRYSSMHKSIVFIWKHLFTSHHSIETINYSELSMLIIQSLLLRMSGDEWQMSGGGVTPNGTWKSVQMENGMPSMSWQCCMHTWQCLKLHSDIVLNKCSCLSQRCEYLVKCTKSRQNANTIYIRLNVVGSNA